MNYCPLERVILQQGDNHCKSRTWNGRQGAVPEKHTSVNPSRDDHAERLYLKVNENVLLYGTIDMLHCLLGKDYPLGMVPNSGPPIAMLQSISIYDTLATLPPPEGQSWPPLTDHITSTSI